jgi:hypothetical protein
LLDGAGVFVERDRDDDRCNRCRSTGGVVGSGAARFDRFGFRHRLNDLVGRQVDLDLGEHLACVVGDLDGERRRDGLLLDRRCRIVDRRRFGCELDSDLLSLLDLDFDFERVDGDGDGRFFDVGDLDRFVGELDQRRR